MEISSSPKPPKSSQPIGAKAVTMALRKTIQELKKDIEMRDLIIIEQQKMINDLKEELKFNKKWNKHITR